MKTGKEPAITRVKLSLSISSGSRGAMKAE